MKYTGSKSRRAGQRRREAAAPPLFTSKSWVWLICLMLVSSGCLLARGAPADSTRTAVIQGSLQATVSRTAGAAVLPATPAAGLAMTASPTQAAATAKLLTVPTASVTATITSTARPQTSPTADLQSWGSAAEDVIRIGAPGAGSKVVSEIEVALEYLSQNAQRLWIELYGSDGRLLARQVLKTGESGGAQRLTRAIPFELRIPEEPALLVISLKDTQGRAFATTSAGLQLMKSGRAALQGPGPLPGIRLQTPQPGEQIQEGRLAVRGLAHLPVREPLRVQLLAQDGSLIAQRLAGVSAEAEAEYAAFTADIDYRVLRPTPAWLVIYEDGKPFVDVAQLITIPVVLLP